MTAAAPQEHAFKAWLESRNYRTSTVTQTLRQIRRARAQWSETGTLLDSIPAALQRYATFARAREGRQDVFDRAVCAAFPDDIRSRRAAAAGRKKIAQSFEDQDWAALVRALQQDHSPEGTVLYVMARTGHRVGDILRISRRRLTRAYKTGILQLERKGGFELEVPLAGAQDAWDRLHTSWRGPADAVVGNWVCPRTALGDTSSEGAYKRVQRYLVALGERLGLSGRVHLHRMRRTVGVSALRQTRDIHLVSQLLGHRSVTSTEAYVDELRREELVDLQRKLGGQA